MICESMLNKTPNVCKFYQNRSTGHFDTSWTLFFPLAVRVPLQPHAMQEFWCCVWLVHTLIAPTSYNEVLTVPGRNNRFLLVNCHWSSKAPPALSKLSIVDLHYRQTQNPASKQGGKEPRHRTSLCFHNHWHPQSWQNCAYNRGDSPR